MVFTINDFVTKKMQDDTTRKRAKVITSTPVAPAALDQDGLRP